MGISELVEPLRTGTTAERTREYLARAEELRTIAEDIRDDDSRVVLLRVAASYERMAVTPARFGPSNGHFQTAH